MAKLTLKQMILNKIDDSPRGFVEELSKVSGAYSSGSNLKKVLKDESKDFDSLNALIKMVKHVFEEDEKKLMEQYSTEIDCNNKLARHMLEYLSCNKLLDSMKNLIERMLQCKNKESREWAKLYALQHEWSLNYYNLDIVSILKNLNEFKTAIPELNTLISIMKCNSYYKQKMYKIAYLLITDVKVTIQNIKDEYMKASFNVKFNEIMSYITLRFHNDPENARMYANNVLELNVGQTFNAYANYIIGYSYFFTSYDKAKESLNECIEIYYKLDKKESIKDIKEELELLEILWDKDIFSIYYDQRYKYYWMARTNKYFELDKINIDSEDPFYFLIKGIKEDNTNLLLQSMIRFVRRGDVFLGNLPKIELLKRGFSEGVINDLLGMY